MADTAKNDSDTWVVDVSRKYGNHARVNSSEKLICSVGNGENPDVSFEEWSVNARLIAAAPDLLKVLKRISDVMDFDASSHPLFSGLQKQMQDAIAKAEGL